MPRYYNPSEYHEEALRNRKPALAYEGQPLAIWREQLAAAFQERFGWDPTQPRGPLNVEELECEETETYIRRKLVFTSEPRADIPCHLLIPKKARMPAPAFICLQGHTTGMHISVGIAKLPGDEKAIEGERDFARQAVAEGYVALAMEQRSFGERAETRQERRSQHGCEDAAMHALLLGRPLAAERAWDVSRAVDFLQTLPEVRPDRIGCMGNSGGGTVTFYAACVEPRLWLAMPSCSFCTYADSIFRIYHCTDNYIPGILRVAEMGDLTGLIAPRRLLIVAGKDDPIFPLEGVRRAFATAQRIYEAAGVAGRLRLIVGEGGHRFYASEAWGAIQEMLRADDGA